MNCSLSVRPGADTYGQSNMVFVRADAALRLGDHCENDQSCKFFDKNTVCAAFDDNISQCACRLKYYPSITIESITRTSICIPG